MDFADKTNWIKEYEKGTTKECPFCGGENLEHSCRNCYLDIDKETCWKYKSYCKKCFVYINEEIPKIDALKRKLGVKCRCNDPNCMKCILVNCNDDNCPVHTKEIKDKKRKKLVNNY